MISSYSYKEFISKAINILIIVAGFVIFINWKYTRAILLLALLLWILHGDFKAKLLTIFKHKLVLTFVVFIALFFIGMLWTDNFYAGRKITERPLLYLVAPIMLTMYRPKYLKYFLWSMLASILFTALLTFLINIGVVDYPYNLYKAPFMNRNYIAGILVFGYSYFLYKIDFSDLKKISNLLWITATILIVYALIVGGSRTGLINLVVATLIILMYKFKFNYKKIFFALISIFVLFIVLYNTNSIVNSRVNKTINVVKNLNMKAQILNHETNRRGALTCRLEFWYYAWELGKKNPLLGVGTGDGIDELGKLIGEKEERQLFSQCSGNGSGQFNPHNMYLFMFMQFGILGVIVFIWILYVHLKVAVNSKNPVFISLIVTVMIALLSSSELFTTRYFIPFYGYAVTLMYLFYLEKKKTNNELL